MTLRSLDQFLESYERNEWVQEPGIEMYVRKATPPQVEEGIHLQFANLQASIRGNGALTAVLDKLEPQMGIMIESILEPRLIPYLEKRGYSFKTYEAQIDAFKPNFEPNHCIRGLDSKFFLAMHR
jgi:hypothetical protein